MTIRNLDKMFKPQSLAVIGASVREGSVGHVLMRNVQAGGFAGAVLPVNPKYDTVLGVKAYPDIKNLPVVPDLAVIVTAPGYVPAAIAELGGRGTKAAVVITAGFAELGTPEGKALERAVSDAAAPHGMRIVGPNCLGIMVPGSRLNASFTHIAPSPGNLAFISQSGAVCTAVLDYVAGRNIGFSHFVSLGNSCDVDFDDMIEYLAADPATQAILLYIESISQVREFMAASRKASQQKPIIVIKSGRNREGARAAASHTGALIGADAVYDIAFRRAGMLRVYTLEELFDAVETLARLMPALDPAPLSQSVRHSRLAIVSNGGGPAVLATDYLSGNGGTLAAFSEETLERLNKILPPTWSHGNPVDLIGDADGARYGKALDAVMQSPETDAVLVMKCPTAVSDNVEAARATIDIRERYRGHGKLMLTCWLGEATVQESRRLFAQARIPTYDTPENAVRAFLHVDEYRHNQAMLLEKPAAKTAPQGAQARTEAIIAAALEAGRGELFEDEAKEVLAAYGIPVVRTLRATSADEAVALAERIGYPVVLKISSPDISHKSDVGGVILSLQNAGQVRHAAETMKANVAKFKPGARLDGFTVQQMAAKREGYELIVGLSTDRQFGPVLMFGEGGVAVEALDDKSLGLPPLNVQLARDMIESTRVWRRLKGFRDQKPVDRDAIVDVLLKISQLACEVASVSELDINPLIASAGGVIALDARIRIISLDLPASRRLAITEPA